MFSATRLLPILLLVPAPLAAQEAMPALPSAVPIAGTRLEIVVEGEVRRVPDRVEIGAGVVTQAATAAEAMAENARRMTATVAALRRAGVAERDIRTASLSLQPQYRYGENQPPLLTGYQASNRVTVNFREIAKAGTILDALVAAGANQIDGPNFSVSDADAALDAARTDAVAKAQARAQLYARAAGLTVARIISISETGAQRPEPPMPMMMRRAAEASDSTPVVPGEQRLAIMLTVSFELR